MQHTFTPPNDNAQFTSIESAPSEPLEYAGLTEEVSIKLRAMSNVPCRGTVRVVERRLRTTLKSAGLAAQGETVP